MKPYTVYSIQPQVNQIVYCEKVDDSTYGIFKYLKNLIY